MLAFNYMKKALLVLFSLVISLGLVVRVHAQEAVATPEVLAATATRTPALLPKVITGPNITLRETINQDVAVFSSNSDIESAVNGNVFAAGGTVKIGGIVNENVVVAGGDVTLTGTVRKNVIVVGGNLKIEQNALVTGYLIAAGGQVEVLGRIDGEVKAMGGKVSVGDKSVLGGNLFVDAKEISVSDKAKIAGTKKLNLIKADEKTTNNVRQGFMQAKGWAVGMFGFFGLIFFAGKVLLLLVLVKIFGSKVTKWTNTVTKTFWSTLGLGLAKLVLTPFLILFLMMTVIGIPLAGAVVFIYIGALCLTQYIGAAILGHMLAMRGWLKTDNLYWQAVIGFVALGLISLVPFIGWLVKLIAVLVGLGLVVRWEMTVLKKKS